MRRRCTAGASATPGWSAPPRTAGRGSTSRSTAPHDALFAVAFLDAVPDEDRAVRAIDALAAGLRSSGLVAAERGDDVQAPLDLSPWPGSRSRRLFGDEEVERDLDALAAGQADDGGWRFGWPVWSDAVAHEWRGVVTVHALRVLRANGRL